MCIIPLGEQMVPLGEQICRRKEMANQAEKQESFPWRTVPKTVALKERATNQAEKQGDLNMDWDWVKRADTTQQRDQQ